MIKEKQKERNVKYKDSLSSQSHKTEEDFCSIIFTYIIFIFQMEKEKELSGSEEAT